MSNNDVSWLSETKIHDLLMHFPLPLAVLDRNDNVKLVNLRFADNFDSACLQSDDLRKVLHDPHDHVPVSVQCDGGPSAVFVRLEDIGGYTIVVLEKSAEASHSAELAEMHKRIIELEKLSSTDRLTGAWNRVHFDKTIAIELSRSVRYRQPVSLIFFDIDHFKQVNDTHGHAVGDEVLRELVKVVRGKIRTSDLLFRWGGEEFVILAPSTRYSAAAILAETLRAKIEQHEIASAGGITISLGVAEHVSGEDESAWFCRVDKALYAAKNGGRNRVEVDLHGSSDVWLADQGPALLRLNWHDSYACGDPTIDHEHRQLFDLANALIDCSFSRNEQPQAFDQALEKLLNHIARHFADEEAILARHHYAGLAVQQHAHQRLIERALQLRDAAAAGGTTIGELLTFLADDVVAKHMLVTDREFYPLFHSPQPG